jgi:uncharacterized protein (UPF0332 family)
MSLASLLAEKRIRPYTTSASEIEGLLRLIERDLADAAIPQLSADRRFATAYNAALQLATIALYAAGYRTVGPAHHWVTFNALPEIIGAPSRAHADYFDNSRTKRNVTDYDRAGEISDHEAREIISKVRAFRHVVLAWLGKNHPGLLPAGAVE